MVSFHRLPWRFTATPLFPTSGCFSQCREFPTKDSPHVSFLCSFKLTKKGSLTEDTSRSHDTCGTKGALDSVLPSMDATHTDHRALGAPLPWGRGNLPRGLCPIARDSCTCWTYCHKKANHHPPCHSRPSSGVTWRKQAFSYRKASLSNLDTRVPILKCPESWKHKMYAASPCHEPDAISVTILNCSEHTADLEGNRWEAQGHRLVVSMPWLRLSKSNRLFHYVFLLSSCLFNELSPAHRKIQWEVNHMPTTRFNRYLCS